MIRTLGKEDIHRVAKIWLDTNQKTHGFLPAQYWESHLTSVKTAFLEAEVYVYVEESTKEILGFLGLQGDYIAGLFVEAGSQGGGIGRQLLDVVKRGRQELTLHVYTKNKRAVQFYQREHFVIQAQTLDKDTGEEEYVMIWRDR